ncbi:unnamed protein product [Schistocephalus solidus]|uniref:C2H2-type domain-containing protein n=1 Tax=Schistocephalus solidus TaxID=70667 RepID=A0A183TH00_SCHSO|nr:unnamed protein product [Schistocephalus solidus]
MIFAACQLQKKYQEMRTHLYTTFVDLTKAFDTVNRDGLWKVMQKFSCPERFTHMMRQPHDGMMARVTDNGTNTEAEMEREDPGHGSPGVDRNPQHPRHAEASATAMERPPDSPFLTPGINSITPTTIETISQYSSPVTPTTATITTFVITTTTTIICDGDSPLNCPQCDRTFTSRIRLVGHLRIHRTETGEPVPGAPNTQQRSPPPLPSLSSRIYSLHGPIRSNAHS